MRAGQKCCDQLVMSATGGELGEEAQVSVPRVLLELPVFKP